MQLSNTVGEAAAEQLISIDAKIQSKRPIPANERNVVLEAVSDRAKRAEIHQVRNHSHSFMNNTRLTTPTVDPTRIFEPP